MNTIPKRLRMWLQGRGVEINKYNLKGRKILSQQFVYNLHLFTAEYDVVLKNHLKTIVKS